MPEPVHDLIEKKKKKVCPEDDRTSHVPLTLRKVEAGKPTRR